MDSENAKHMVFTMNFIDFAKSADFFFFFKTFSSWAREAENPKNLRDLRDLRGWRLQGPGIRRLSDELPPELQIEL